MARHFFTSALFWLGLVSPALAETKSVFLQESGGERIEIASLTVHPDGTYDIAMSQMVFSDHFLSMRPFKCIAGSEKTWCHVPYPYEITRNISDDLTDLEYDFLFIWKRSNEYGIDMWNGVYYEIEEQDARLEGRMFEMDMNVLSVPPDAGVLRPINDNDLTEGDPDSHWLPVIVIE